MKRQERYNQNRTHKGKKAMTKRPEPSSNLIELEGVVSSSNEPFYSASLTLNPSILEKSRKEIIHDRLPEQTTGKMTSKKKKRLEKFIEKQLKKEERVHLIEELSNKTFNSQDLLISSKSLGKNKLTMKEKLRLTLLEHKAGLVPSQKDNRLFVTKEIDESTFFKSRPQIVVTSSFLDEKLGDVEQQNENSKAKDEVDIQERQVSQKTIEVLNLDGNSTIEPLKKLSGFSFPSNSTASFGSGLKRANQDSSNDTTMKSTKRKKKIKNNDIVQNSDSEADQQVKLINNPKVKNWSSNVVDGEKIVNNVPQDIINLKHLLKCKEAELKASIPIVETTKVPISGKPAFYVVLKRPAHIEKTRDSLPVVAEEQPIMEAIYLNPIVILCGETGSGKTTQVPQFLYEAGFGDPNHPEFPGMIGITQPRRVAAISMAQRVAEEMGLNGDQVGYQIRYDSSTVTSKTRIKFMTDGILLRELSMAATDAKQSTDDLLLTKYSCIIIDEAHERTVGTDVLIGWLSRISSIRNASPNHKPLRIIIMSATLRVQDFSENKTLFPLFTPPVLKIDGRQYKVSVHYNKVTPEVDYVTEAFKKISKIHTKLPKGGILVFLTGQQEIQILVKKLEKRFPNWNVDTTHIASCKEDTAQIEHNALTNVEEINDVNELTETIEETDDFNEMDFDSDDEEKDIHILDGASDDEKEDDITPASKTVNSLHILPLYSLLSTESQMRVFEAPPTNSRLCVIATNVAETSVTIPGIKYVVDCGKVKQREYDPQTQTQTFRIGWTSKASSDQRAGRAGRNSSGHCYRLFSSAVFSNHFSLHSIPEVLRVPIDSVVLQMKSMGINHVTTFPFPTPPPKHLLASGEKLLVHLGALSKAQKITALGKLMANIPVSPRFAKMLIVAAQQKDDVLQYMIALVCGLAVGDVFIHDQDIIAKPKEKKIKKRVSINDESEDDIKAPEPESESEVDGDQKEALKTKRGAYYRVMQMLAGDPPTSDAIRILRAIGAYLVHSKHPTESSIKKFCDKMFIRPKALEEILKLRTQISHIIKNVLGNTNDYPNISTLTNTMKPPSTKQIDILRQLMYIGHVDHVAVLKHQSVGDKHGLPTYTALQNDDNTEELCIHPSSSVFKERPAPKYIIYTELVAKEERVAIDNSSLLVTRETDFKYKRLWMKGVTIIDETWLSSLGPETLLNTGKMLDMPEPKYDTEKDVMVGFYKPRYGPKSWELAITEGPVNDYKIRVTFFLKLLLEGKVPLSTKAQNVFGILLPYYLLKPSAIPKIYSQTNKKVVSILSACLASNIDTRALLIQKWKDSPVFLKEEVCAFLPSDISHVVSKHWPPVIKGKENRIMKELVEKTVKYYDKRKMYQERESDVDSD